MAEKISSLIVLILLLLNKPSLADVNEIPKQFGFGKLSCFTISQNEDLIATGSYDKKVRIWDRETEKVIATFEGHLRPVESVAFSSDNKYLLSGGQDCKIKCWDVSTGECLETYIGHRGYVNSVEFSLNDSTFITSSSDKTVKLWNRETGECIKSYVGHTGLVSEAHFSPDNSKILTCSYDSTIRIWDVMSQEELLVFQKDTSANPSAVFSPDGSKILVGYSNGTGAEINALTGLIEMTWSGLSWWYSYVDYFPDGSKFITGGKSVGSFIIWDAHKDEPIDTVIVSSGSIGPLQITGTGTILLTGLYQAQIVDLNTGEILQNHQGYSSSITSVDFSSDNSRILSSQSNNCIVWNAFTGDSLFSLSGKMHGIKSAEFSPNDSFIIVGSFGYHTSEEFYKNTVQLCNAETGDSIRSFKGHFNSVYSVTFTPTGSEILSASADSTIRRWNVESGELIKVYNSSNSGLRTVAISPDETKIAGGNESGNVLIWETSTGSLIANLEGPEKCVNAISFSNDGKKLVAGADDKNIYLWELDGDSIAEKYPQKHTLQVTSVYFSPDDTQILSGAADGDMIVWDVKNSSPKQTIDVSTLDGNSLKVSYSSDGNQILTGGNDGRVLLWDNNEISNTIVNSKNSLTSPILEFTSKNQIRLSQIQKNLLFKNADFSMYQFNGKLLKRVCLSKNMVSSGRIDISLPSEIPTGVYICHIRGLGTKSFSGKITIKK